ncbi:MAG: hypothetical protein MZU79_09200 [Anaerotruncus sp.]|nr:hypothetical protein [Anaerotruncus sp.]
MEIIGTLAGSLGDVAAEHGEDRPEGTVFRHLPHQEDRERVMGPLGMEKPRSEAGEDGKREIVEALIFSASGSLPVKDILKVLPETTPGEIEQLMKELNGIYESSRRSFRIERASSSALYVTLEVYPHTSGSS